jgi:hypothetical protein
MAATTFAEIGDPAGACYALKRLFAHVEAAHPVYVELRLPHDVAFCCVSISKIMTLLPAAVAAVVAMTTSRLVESVEVTAKVLKLALRPAAPSFFWGCKLVARAVTGLARWGRAGGFSSFSEGNQTLGGVRGLREDKIGVSFLPERKNPVAKAAPSLHFLRPAVIQTKEFGFSIMFRKIS